MGEWKKVIVSGSNAELNNITSSANISASGKLYGGLAPTTDQTYVIIYDTQSGEFKYKELNLINTAPAPPLFVVDPDGGRDTHFRLGFDRDSVTQPITPPTLLSASYVSGGILTTKTCDNNVISINGLWEDIDIVNELYYKGYSIDNTANIPDRRDGLWTNGSTDSSYNSQSIVLYLNSISNDNVAVPAFDDTYDPNFNYGNRAFRDGGIGSLEIYVNDNVTPKRSFNLENNLGAVNSISDNITVTLFATQSNIDNTGEVDTTKHYRSGSITLLPNSQRDGYNFVYIIHTGSKDGEDFAYITNFYEWFYDIDGKKYPLTASAGNTELPVFNSSDIDYVSGVKYFKETSANSAVYRRMASCTNQYRNIYSGGWIVSQVGNLLGASTTFTQSGDNLTINPNYSTATIVGNSNTVVGSLRSLTDTNQSYLQTTYLTASFTTTFSNLTNHFQQPSNFITSPWGIVTSSGDFGTNQITFTHVNKALKTVSFPPIKDYLLNTLNSNSNNYEFEDFKREDYRILSGTYSAGANPTTSAWNETQNIINGTAGHQKGLLQYYSHLVYPTKAGVNGNFTASLGPTSNTNYSSAAGEREYYRYFQVQSTQEGTLILNIELLGQGRIVSDDHTTHFGNGDNDALKLYVWRSGGGVNSYFTGEFVNVMDSNIYQGNTFDQSQEQWIPLSSTVVSYSSTNSLGSPSQNFRTGVARVKDATSASSFFEGEYIIIKIVVPEGWEGNIQALGLQHGSTVTTPILTTDYSGNTL